MKPPIDADQSDSVGRLILLKEFEDHLIDHDRNWLENDYLKWVGRKTKMNDFTDSGFYMSAVPVFWKHGGKMRNCSWRAISPLHTVCSTQLENFLPFLSNLKWSSADFFSLEESLNKICRLGKGQLMVETHQNLFLPEPSALFWESFKKKNEIILNLEDLWKWIAH